MNETEPILRITSERRELEGVRQAELGAKRAQAVKELDGLGIGHRFDREYRIVSISVEGSKDSLPGSEHELDVNLFAQTACLFPRAGTAPGHIFRDAPQHHLRVEPGGQRKKVPIYGELQIEVWGIFNLLIVLLR